MSNIRLVDTETGIVYELSVVDGNLTMDDIGGSGVDAYTVTDELTGIMYKLTVANSKLIMSKGATDDVRSRLIDYLPPFIQKYHEIKAIMNAEQVETDTAWIGTENVLNDQFIQDATQNGVARYEKILGITPKSTYTLDERKFNILAAMNVQLPYTVESLQSSLESLCGADGYTLVFDTDSYHMAVKLALNNANNLEAVKELLCNIIPANIVTDVGLFNQYMVLGGYTHEQLATYTHQGVREEMLS